MFALTHWLFCTAFSKAVARAAWAHSPFSFWELFLWGYFLKRKSVKRPLIPIAVSRFSLTQKAQRKANKRNAEYRATRPVTSVAFWKKLRKNFFNLLVCANNVRDKSKFESKATNKFLTQNSIFHNMVIERAMNLAYYIDCLMWQKRSIYE